MIFKKIYETSVRKILFDKIFLTPSLEYREKKGDKRKRSDIIVKFAACSCKMEIRYYVFSNYDCVLLRYIFSLINTYISKYRKLKLFLYEWLNYKLIK